MTEALTVMSRRFTRNASILMWLVLFGLLPLLWSPITAVTGALLLAVGIVGSATMIIVWQEPASVAVPHPVDPSRPGW